MNRILLLTSLIVSCFSFGQAIRSSIVKEQVLNESLNHALIGASGNTLVGVSTDKKNMHIDIYDKDSLDLLYHEQVKLSGNDEFQLEVNGVYQVKDQFKLVVTGFSLKFGSNQYGIFIYDIQENGQLGETVEKKIFSGKVKSNLTAHMTIDTNPENTQLLFHLAFEQKMENRVDHALVIYDEALHNLYEYERLAFPKRSKEMAGLSYYLGNDNHVYELCQKVTYNKSIKNYQSVLELKKFGFKSQEAVATQSVAVPDGHLLEDIQFVEHGPGLTLIASYLSGKKKTIVGIQGVFMVDFDADLSVKSQMAQVFSKDTKQKTLVGFEKPEELEVPLLYKLKQVVTDSQGNHYVLFERESADRGNYYFGSIIVVKINDAGKGEWDLFIPKSQFFKSPITPYLLPISIVGGFAGATIAMALSDKLSEDVKKYLSFLPVLKNDELFLIYNDNPQNEGRKSGQSRINLTKIKESVPFAIHLSPQGIVAYHMLGDLKKESGSQRIIYSTLEGNTLFSLNDSGKTEILQRIELE